MTSKKQLFPGVVFASRQLNLDLDAGRRWTERAIAEYERNRRKKRKKRTAAAIAAHMNVAAIGRIAREEETETETRPAVNVAAAGAAAVKKAV